MSHLRTAARRVPALVVATALAASMLATASGIRASSDSIPERLTDRDWWNLIGDLSEPNGAFQSDNLVSNEVWFQYILDDLKTRTTADGVYLGVGPEQNFTYIAATRPKAAFIIDVRRGNLQMHLLYKALFELSKDRAAFVARLFGRRVAPLGDGASAADLFTALDQQTPESAKDLEMSARQLSDVLTKKHHLPLPEDDIAAIDANLKHFHTFGPGITYNSTSTGGLMPSYRQLMTATNGASELSYLSSDERFAFIKDLEERNLIVPVVGNFAGPRALRAIGQYIRDHGASVTAMYVSNVEQYLVQDRSWNAFCANVASMPLDPRSTFIRSSAVSNASSGVYGLMSYLSPIVEEIRACGK